MSSQESTQMNEYERNRRRARMQRIIKVRRMKRLLLACVGTLILIGAISFGLFAFSSHACVEKTSKKMYTCVCIESGDTLYSLAASYPYEGSIEDFIHETKKINHLENDIIYSGQYLVIPYFITV